MLIFFRVLGYAHKKIFQTKHFKRQGYVGQSVLSVLSQWHDTMHLQKKGVKVYLWNALVTKHLALTI